ncbi:hypothetical protein V8B97DRAFT_1915489 [Scleroderma yunnanense]
MDPDRTPRVSPVIIGSSEAHGEHSSKLHGIPTSPGNSINASRRHSSRGDDSQHVEHPQSAPPVPPKALILPLDSEKNPSDAWTQSQDNYQREMERGSRRRSSSTLGRGGWEDNLYSPSRRTTLRRVNREITPGMDAHVPVIQSPNSLTVRYRIQETISEAEKERDFSAQKAKRTNFALNVAVGIQVMLGALLTGLSAVTVGRQTYVITSILGGVSTLVASYLARSRGSSEPELSIGRVKDLDHFLRDCRAFRTDYGHAIADQHNDLEQKVEELRHRFEELLGNANGYEACLCQ